MKRIYIILVLVSVLFGCEQPKKETSQEQTQESEVNTETVVKGGYDAEAAKKYSSDDYGMKKYVFAFLKKGDNRDLDSARSVELQKAHLENIVKMAEAGKLVLAGPFFGDGDLRGIYVFNVETIAEAEALTNSDPAIQEGSLKMELKEWYGSAALMAINDIHKTLEKKSVVSDAK